MYKKMNRNEQSLLFNIAQQKKSILEQEIFSIADMKSIHEFGVGAPFNIDKIGKSNIQTQTDECLVTMSEYNEIPNPTFNQMVFSPSSYDRVSQNSGLNSLQLELVSFGSRETTAEPQWPSELIDIEMDYSEDLVPAEAKQDPNCGSNSFSCSQFSFQPCQNASEFGTLNVPVFNQKIIAGNSISIQKLKRGHKKR
jgi:hypothetical protein